MIIPLSLPASTKVAPPLRVEKMTRGWFERRGKTSGRTEGILTIMKQHSDHEIQLATRRDAFIAAALTGLLANGFYHSLRLKSHFAVDEQRQSTEALVAQAVQIADETMRQTAVEAGYFDDDDAARAEAPEVKP